MSDELYQKFRIFLTEGLLGVGENQVLEYLDSKGYQGDKRKEAIDAYMSVTHDPILGPMVPELSSYDLNSVNIKELYNEKKRQIELSKQSKPKLEEPPKDSTISLIEDKKRYQEQIEKNIADTQKVMVQEPSSIPSTLESHNDLPDPSVFVQKNNRAKSKILSQTGYANIVLMSIIVIIIVAIICVFIFAN